MVGAVQACSVHLVANPQVPDVRGEDEATPQGTAKSREAAPARKASRESVECPYRTPTLVGEEHPPQVNGRPSAKELGNLAP